MKVSNINLELTSTIEIKEEFIHLSQLMKMMGWVENGGAAGYEITEGKVKVNGEVEYRKRNKIYKGFVVEFMNESVKIE